MTAGDFDERMRRMERLLEEMERVPDTAVLDQVRDLVRAVLEVHRSGLEALLRKVKDPALGGGDALIRAAALDPAVASLLLLHDLHPEADLGDGAWDEKTPAMPSDFVPVERLVARSHGAPR